MLREAAWLMTLFAAATTIDRLAVIVNQHAIKLSDLQRDLRLTEFMNGQSLDLGSDARRRSADRLIDQTLIRDEVAHGGFRRATDSDAGNMLSRLREQRFGGSESRLRAELSRYGLSEEQLHEQLLWQLTVLRFIDQRFRPGIDISDEEVRAYYSQHSRT